MPKNSAEDFFQRACEKGSEINKEIVNDAEVKIHLEQKTKGTYTRAWML